MKINLIVSVSTILLPFFADEDAELYTLLVSSGPMLLTTRECINGSHGMLIKRVTLDAN